MPLSAPTIDRQPRHIRSVRYQSFERSDGLWDVEGELIDTKAMDVPRLGSGIFRAGEPIHHMHIRVTVDTRLVVHAIEAAMDAHPIQGCPAALDAMQRMVGCCMAKGWRKAIEANLGKVAGCTHMRELLMNMATAAFQSIGAAFGGDIVRAGQQMHGKTSVITTDQKGVFAGLPQQFTVNRYHSLVIDKATLPACLTVTATSEDGEIQGVRHTTLAVEGVQFHPESILTEHGHAMLKNFLQAA